MEPIVCIGLIPAQKSCQTRPEFECFGDGRQSFPGHPIDCDPRIWQSRGSLEGVDGQALHVAGRGSTLTYMLRFPPNGFPPAGWEVEKLEELALAAGTAAPGPGVQEKLVFLPGIKFQYIRRHFMDMTNESCRKFVEVLASMPPTPGGGGAAALVGGCGYGLGQHGGISHCG